MDGGYVIPTLDWSLTEGRQYFYLLIHIDGDYIDLYIDNTGNRVGTFVSVSDEFVRQFRNLIRTNTADMSNVTWPRRADGTMDYPPPGIDMSGFQTSHATTARLRIRDNPATDSLIVTTLDAGAEVQVLETGPVETIGDATAPWVRLLAANGFTGWAFSGSLESIAPAVEPEPDEAPANAEAPAERPAPVAQNDEDAVSMPPWALIAIAGGAVVAFGGLALLAVRKKR